MTDSGAAYWLTTPRCGLRHFRPADLDWLVDVYADEAVTRFLGGVQTRAVMETLFRTRFLEYYEAHPGLGIWMTHDRATGQPLGFHLLNHVQGETDIQVGFALLQPAWGQGFATEVAGALLRYGFRDLGLPRIVGIANLENVASQHVLGKIGLVRGADRAHAHPAYVKAGPMAFFDRARDEWLAERGFPTSPA